MTPYVKNNSAVFTLKYHLVWCSKYRRKVLVGDVEHCLKEILLAEAERSGLIIHALEIMPEHVHMFVETDPTWAPAGLAARFKGKSSNILRNKFPFLKSRLPTLWSRSYYVGSVGSVTEASVQKYIEGQKRSV